MTKSSTLPVHDRVTRMPLTTTLGFSEQAQLLRATRRAVGEFAVMSVTENRPTLEEEFAALRKWWQRETWMHSADEVRISHPAYRRVIGLGQPVVGLLLDAMETESEHWFAALQAITGVDPVPDTAKGHVKEEVAAWLRWARTQGIR